MTAQVRWTMTSETLRSTRFEQSQGFFLRPLPIMKLSLLPQFPKKKENLAVYSQISETFFPRNFRSSRFSPRLYLFSSSCVRENLSGLSLTSILGQNLSLQFLNKFNKKFSPFTKRVKIIKKKLSRKSCWYGSSLRFLSSRETLYLYSKLTDSVRPKTTKIEIIFTLLNYITQLTESL